MPVIKLVDTSQYELKVYTEDGEGFRIAFDDDNPERVILFQMRRLSRAEKTKLDDDLVTNKGMKLGTYQITAMRKTIRGWSGIQVEDGAEFPYSIDNIDKLPPRLFALLDEHIASANGLKDETAKN